MTAAAMHGDEGELYALHGDRLRRVIGQLVHAPAEVIDDACQDAWLILLRAQPRRQTVWPWLVTVARRQAWRLAEDARRIELPDDDTLEPAAADLELQIGARLALQTAAGCLGPRQRRIVGLRASGHAYAEIAAITGDSPRTVERQLLHARRALRAAA